MKEEKKAAKKKAAKKGTKRLENILDLNANNIWDLDEFAIAEAWERNREEQDFSISEAKLLNTIRLAFEIVHYNPEDERAVEKYENGGWAKLTHCKEEKGCVAIRRKAIERITDLSYENIRHISTAMLLELIDRNFGGGWDSLNQGVKDIILSAFDISTTTTPKERLHKPGGLYEIKVEDGYEVLEIEKGSWTEAIFAKVKPKAIKLKMSFDAESKNKDGYDGDDSDEDVEVRDDYYKQDEDDDDIDDDSLTEESYRTTVEEDPDDLSLDDADEISDDDY